MYQNDKTHKVMMVSLKQCANMTECFRNNSLIIQFEIKLHLHIIMTSGFIKKGQQQPLLIKCTVK